jgi:hypothetical protein
MKDGFYQFMVGVLDLFLWGGKLMDEENVPKRGPAVFVANHLDATGPIATACSIPLRIHTWVIADMMDRDLAPIWLQADFVERQLHLNPPLSRWIARVLCSISVPLFHSLGCIPVYAGDYEMMHTTLESSMGVLREGKFILVFPEDYRLQKDHVTKMQPFQHSFARLGERYYAETRECLGFHPVTIHGSGTLVVGKPVFFNPLNPVGVERRRLKELMEDTISSMYLQLEGGNISRSLSSQNN